MTFLFSTWHAGDSEFHLNHKLTAIFMGSKLRLEKGWQFDNAYIMSLE